MNRLNESLASHIGGFVVSLQPQAFNGVQHVDSDQESIRQKSQTVKL